jgi:8-oxo-dGTP pyrophosphatase MutT (NUDIX family)
MDIDSGEGQEIVEPDEEAIRDCLSENAPLRIDPEGYKIAAVLMPLLYGKKGWDVLLTKRTEHLKHHKGEISFPGGHKEPGDPHLMFTALRETEEEVGIPPQKVKVLGRLDDITTITGFRVRPYVGVVENPVQLCADPEEIDEILIFPLREFMDKKRLTVQTHDIGGSLYDIYFFKFPDHVVWGATARIIVRFMEKCAGYELRAST